MLFFFLPANDLVRLTVNKSINLTCSATLFNLTIYELCIFSKQVEYGQNFFLFCHNSCITHVTNVQTDRWMNLP